MDVYMVNSYDSLTRANFLIEEGTVPALGFSVHELATGQNIDDIARRDVSARSYA